MRYIFKILILGDPKCAVNFVSRALKMEGEPRESYQEWFNEYKVLNNECDLELNVITDFSANFDDIIPMVDGVFYFINPLNEEEYEFFDLILPIIDSVRRDIPMVILFYDEEGIIPISANKLLNIIWENYPDKEAFINLPPSEFSQAIQCLCLSLILGDSPLNIENAWMRFPVYIKLANQFYQNQDYYSAAQSIKKAASVAEFYRMDEYFILCEQAAFLFSKSSLFLEASQILKKADKRKSQNYKKLYAEAMIREGNKLFNKKDFETAARQYETAANWSFIELKEKHLIQESFKLAINSWISACKIEPAFRILERLSQEEKKVILNDVSDKIVAAANFLQSSGQIKSAKEMLYTSINTYQREGLFDNLEKFSYKLVSILKEILDDDISKQDIYAAKSTYDEIENLWEAFNVKKTDMDYVLEKLTKKFLEELNFGMSSILINKLNSLELKQKLTEFASEVEDKKEDSIKQEKLQTLEKTIEVINQFVKAEYELVIELNKSILKDAEILEKKKEYINAASIIKGQAEYLKSIGKNEISDQILGRAMDILVKGRLFEQFFKYYQGLSGDRKKAYISQIFPIYIAQLKELKVDDGFEENQIIFDQSNKIYRNQMLYEESKEISEVFIEFIKIQALKSVESEENISGINNALELIKKINSISSSYLDNKKINYDEIYRKIAVIYINLDDLSSAHAYNDRIEDKKFKSEIHARIAKIEAKLSAIKSREAEISLKGEILKERLSIIKKKARDAFNEKENEFKQRRGLRRAYFKDAIDNINKDQLDKAIETYKESTILINRIKKYNLAGVSFAVACLLLIKNNRIDEIENLLKEIKVKVSTSEKIFSETFPVTLIEYISDLNKLHDEEKLNEALSFLEQLPLFEEEKKVLFGILGKEKNEVEKEEVKEKPSISLGEIATLRSEINKIGKTIIFEKQDIAKRKMMKRQYWQGALLSLKNNDNLSAALAYLDAVPKLSLKKFHKHAVIGLIMGSLLLVKEKDINTASLTLEKSLKELYNDRKNIEEFPEFFIIKKLLFAYEHNVDNLIKLCLEYLIDKIWFFDEERDFLKNITEPSDSKREAPTKSSRKERGEQSKLIITLNQKLGNLQEKLRGIKADSNDFFIKRKAMRRRYYEEILMLIKKKSFKEASKKYTDVIKTVAKRRDIKTCSLLMLLHSLSLLKAGESLKLFKAGLDQYISSLGLNKKLIEDSFYFSLLLLIIDVVVNEIEEFIPKLKKILEFLPFFPEEKELITF